MLLKNPENEQNWFSILWIVIRGKEQHCCSGCGYERSQFYLSITRFLPVHTAGGCRSHHHRRINTTDFIFGPLLLSTNQCKVQISIITPRTTEKMPPHLVNWGQKQFHFPKCYVFVQNSRIWINTRHKNAECITRTFQNGCYNHTS